MKQIILILVLLISCGSLSAQNNSSRKGKGKNYTTQIKELEAELREAYEKNAELEEKIDELTEIINGAYVLIASKEDLKKIGIYTSNQLSKNRFDHSNLDKKWFKSVDIRDCRRFEIFDESPQVLTAMPKDSYKTEKTERHTSVLEITDINRFWAITKYLVIMAN